MDVLKDKEYISYPYISRYASFPTYYNSMDRKYVYGLTSHLRESGAYLEYQVKQGDTLESISQKSYGRPDYYWVIADYNRITDPFIDLFENYVSIRVPNISGIVFSKR